ncbi:Phenol hydroxylase, P4 oxygenase component DmpO [Castellaniella defragrans 65Phen]|uniref:Phenol hydroxylase, P4 oxygenase component DmpO n=1 Tax=Castellaniella defragrans (strain DSM 12143 / CCUG 39792 / 65Phen) TaxID=1437824 RepID=W8X224_CASD6|nr:phenol hydroxylase subunit P4 [Castellaniella defragrans]CDM23342.1 Phenol hydroxylase, P4 oxygenase component DmpO [Castellaniella defragrans 65Phen]
MAVKSLGPYDFPPKDRLENFHGNQLTYIGWEDHLLFCAPFCFPFPPDMPFGLIIDQVLPGAFGYHPDFARIDWSKVEWFKSGRPWTPQHDKSLAENGLRHKDVLRFRTPGLTGIHGSRM